MTARSSLLFDELVARLLGVMLAADDSAVRVLALIAARVGPGE